MSIFSLLSAEIKYMSLSQKTRDLAHISTIVKESGDKLKELDEVFKNIADVLRSTIDNNEKIDKITDILL